MVWLALILVVALLVFLFRTPRGLRAALGRGEPAGRRHGGISPIRVRYLAVIASGVLAALGGVFLSIGFVHSFSQNMTAGPRLHRPGRGDLRQVAARAARSPRRCCSASRARSRSGCRSFSPSTATLFQALPYVLTLIAVAGLVGRSRPPAADGIPYERW